MIWRLEAEVSSPLSPGNARVGQFSETASPTTWSMRESRAWLTWERECCHLCNKPAQTWWHKQQQCLAIIVSQGSEGWGSSAKHPQLSLSRGCGQVVAAAGIISEASSHVCLPLDVGCPSKLPLGLSAGRYVPGAPRYTGRSHPWHLESRASGGCDGRGGGRRGGPDEAIVLKC